MGLLNLVPLPVDLLLPGASAAPPPLPLTPKPRDFLLSASFRLLRTCRAKITCSVNSLEALPCGSVLPLVSLGANTRALLVIQHTQACWHDCKCSVIVLLSLSAIVNGRLMPDRHAVTPAALSHLQLQLMHGHTHAAQPSFIEVQSRRTAMWAMQLEPLRH